MIAEQRKEKKDKDEKQEELWKHNIKRTRGKWT